MRLRLDALGLYIDLEAGIAQPADDDEPEPESVTVDTRQYPMTEYSGFAPTRDFDEPTATYTESVVPRTRTARNSRGNQ